jgi:hypothetical protein
MVLEENLNDMEVIKRYKQFFKEMIWFNKPNISEQELEDVMNWSIQKRIKNSSLELYDSYKEKRADSSVLEWLEYFYANEPIITPNGVMFKKHNEELNPVNKMIQGFLKTRAKYKKEMFKYPKGSREFEKYNLLQLLSKIDANSIYGCLGNWSAVYYNVNVASSVTACGKSSISAAGLAFEQFLANNVKFRKLDEVIVFINHIIKEKPNRKFNDKDILDRDITVEECFIKVMSTCGHGYTPSMEDCEIIWDIISKLNSEDLNRIYYKNNLLEFFDNKVMTNMVIEVLKRLNKPWMDPNKVPKEIELEMDTMWDLVSEYVFYKYQIIDRQDRLEFLPRKITCIIDTDSFA